MSLMTQVGSQTPTEIELIKEAIRENQLEINTMLPAEVIEYDALIQTCTVQPLLKRTSIDPPSVDSRPRIFDVPVIFPRNSTSGVFFPLVPGDTVALIFCQRSLDDWIDNGGDVQVNDTRLHDITDAVAFAGFYPTSGAINPPQASDATELRGDKILIGKTGTSDEPMVLGNVLQSNLEDLIDAISDLVALLKAPAPIVAATTAGGANTGFSIIVTTAVEAALAGVKSALPDENSDFIFGEKG